MSRRKDRRFRRDEKRKKNREQKLEKYQDFNNFCSYASLYDASRQSANGIRWKESVQRYRLNLFTNLYETRKNLLDGKDIRQGFIEFIIIERGKLRRIRSVHYKQRVAEKSYCKNALCPILTYNLIKDNGASQKGKGTLFAHNRLITALNRYYNENGKSNEGYILITDFKSYFDSIMHEPLKEIIRKFFKDEKLIKLSYDFIDAFGDRGLGLGSETSQISAISYLNELDHYIKEIEGIKGYGRYMDDSYVISKDKNELKRILDNIRKICNKYGITMNERKTKIFMLKRGFIFLKTKFFMLENCKIVKKPCKDSITVERRKLKKHYKMLLDGVMEYSEVRQSFFSWMGSMKRRNSGRTVMEMKKLYRELFLDYEREYIKQLEEKEKRDIEKFKKFKVKYKSKGKRQKSRNVILCNSNKK